MSEYTEAVYDVLVSTCGAYDSYDNRVAFAQLWPECREYRFQGSLGFGGKVWADRDQARVTCYSENETLDRTHSMKRANAALAKLGPPRQEEA